MHLDVDLEMVSLLTVIGDLPQDAGADFYKLLLKVKGAWHQSGGVQMAIDDADRLVQILRLPENIDEQAWLHVVLDQRDKAQAWKKLLAAQSNNRDRADEDRTDAECTDTKRTDTDGTGTKPLSHVWA